MPVDGKAEIAPGATCVLWTASADLDLYVLPFESLEIVFRQADDGTISGVTLRRAGDSGNSYSRLTDS